MIIVYVVIKHSFNKICFLFVTKSSFSNYETNYQAIIKQ